MSDLLISAQTEVLFDRIAAALEAIAGLPRPQTEVLSGFHHGRSGRPGRTVFIGRSGAGNAEDSCWYSLDADSNRVPIAERFLTGRLVAIEAVTVERRGEPVRKLSWCIETEAERIWLSTGIGTAAARSLVPSLLAVGDRLQREAITLAVKPGENDPAVVLLSVYDQQQEWVRPLPLEARDLETAIARLQSWLS